MPAEPRRRTSSSIRKPAITPITIVPWTWVVDGDLMPPGLSISHSDTPSGVGRPHFRHSSCGSVVSTGSAGTVTGVERLNMPRSA
jgi:hypothetical protein